MRILLINARYQRVGGTEVYLHQLLDALRERGHELALFSQEPAEERVEPRLLVLRRPDFDPPHLVRHLGLFDAFRAFAGDFRPDVVHAHNLHTFPATFPRVVAELGLPVLLHPHEFGLLCPNAWCTWPDGTPCPGGPGRKCFEHDCSRNYPIDARVVAVARLRFLHARRMASAVACGSDALAGLMRANGFPDVRTLRYFAEPLKFGGKVAIDELRVRAPRERDHVLYLGRLEPEKGVDTLLRAMPLVRRERPEARLSVVGGGSQRAALEDRARELGLGEAVRFVGPVPHAEVAPWLARASLQVLPSIWAENAAQSCYDCLLFGLPLIASRVAALPEIVRDGVNGLLFAPRDPADLAAQVLRVLGDVPLARRLSASCAKELRSYDKQVHLAALEALLGELVAHGRGGRVPDGDPELESALEEFDQLFVDATRTG